MAAKILPDAAYLRECFDYDPETGELRWRERPRSHFENDRQHRLWNGRYSASRAGWSDRLGYRHVSIDGGKFLLHRVIWLLQTGACPAAEIDHIDRDPSNNRWTNLREANRTENMWNSTRERRSLPRGVYVKSERPGGYYVCCRVDGRAIYRGPFTSVTAAREVYLEIVRPFQGVFLPNPDDP